MLAGVSFATAFAALRLTNLQRGSSHVHSVRTCCKQADHSQLANEDRQHVAGDGVAWGGGTQGC